MVRLAVCIVREMILVSRLYIVSVAPLSTGLLFKTLNTFLEKSGLESLRISKQRGANKQCRSKVEILSNLPIFPAKQSIFSANRRLTSVRKAELRGSSS